MEKYRLVQEHKASVDAMNDSSGDFLRIGNTSQFPEVRITQQGKPRNYISYAMNLFSDGSGTIVLKAMGRAINKAVTIAEILKRKMPLHQMNLLSSVEMVDVYEPIEEGLDVVVSRRYVSCMKITLSKDANALDVEHIGYQPPLSSEDIQQPHQQSHYQQHQPHYQQQHLHHHHHHQ